MSQLDVESLQAAAVISRAPLNDKIQDDMHNTGQSVRTSLIC